jgi:hypothetical protein
MNLKFLVLLTALLSVFQLAMADRGQYDEEAREAERLARLEQKSERDSKNPFRQFAGGVKQATVDNTSDLISETAEGTREASVNSTVEGVNRGSQKVLDNTVKGAVKVATLGYGEVDNYEVVEPAKDSDETTKIRIKIPGT